MSWTSRVVNVFRPGRALADLDDELQFHVEQRADDLVREGMGRHDAELLARRHLGNSLALRESCYDVKAAGWLDSVFRDFHLGLRLLRRHPAFAILATLTLALGIGATTAVFSLVNALLLRPLPYPSPEQLVFLYEPNPHIAGVPLVGFWPIVGDFYDWQKQSRSFASLALFTADRMNMGVNNTAVRVPVSRVSGDLFRLLGIGAALGRTVDRKDDQPGSSHVAVISHALWQSQFGSDRGVLGKDLMLNAQHYRIIGVMPDRFAFPSVDEVLDLDVHGTDVWVPLGMTPQEKATRDTNSGFYGIGRLRQGVSAEQAQAELKAIAARLDPLHSPLRGWDAVVKPLNWFLVELVRAPALIFMGAVALVLLIACSNVASLVLSRASGRSLEMSVRMAVGAPRIRLIRQLLSESLSLALVGGALGGSAAFAAMRLLSRGAADIPRFDRITMDGRVLLIAAVTIVGTALVCGIFPALSASRCSLHEVLKSAGSRTVKGAASRLRRGLMIAEIAISFVLLVSSGLLIRSFIRVQSVDKGFVPASTISVHIQLDQRYNRTEHQVAFFRELVEKTGALPGVEGAAAIDHRPFGGGETFTSIEVEGRSFDEKQPVETRSVSPQYFETMRIPLLAGRGFSGGDIPGRPPVYVVNRKFAEQYFSGRSAAGKRFRFRSGDAHTDWVTIAGVVGDVRYMGIEDSPPPQIYSSLWQNGGDAAYIVARTSLPTNRLVTGLRTLAREIDPAVAVADVHTMSELFSEAMAPRRIETLILSAFGGVGLFLSLVGLYALMAYFVQQRTPEIGIRMALGAQPRSLIRMVLEEGARLACSGIALGLVCAWGATRFMSSLLFEIQPLDAPTFLGVALLFGVVALAACYVPARRATRVDPMMALRCE
jgi:putative ABC transport system permease protein